MVLHNNIIGFFINERFPEMMASLVSDWIDKILCDEVLDDVDPDLVAVEDVFAFTNEVLQTVVDSIYSS